mgnify:CR=1 FL=1
MIKDFGIMTEILGLNLANMNRPSSNMTGFKDKLINVTAFIILFPVMLPIWFAGMVFGLALYIFDKKNKGLGH